MIAPPEPPPEVAIAARAESREVAAAELSPALLRRAARAGIEQGPARLLPIVGAHLDRVWWAGDDVVVLRRNERWSWAAPGASYDEIRHAPTCETEPEALAALLDWLDRPSDRRPDWLAGRRPDWLTYRRRT